MRTVIRILIQILQNQICLADMIYSTTTAWNNGLFGKSMECIVDDTTDLLKELEVSE